MDWRFYLGLSILALFLLLGIFTFWGTEQALQPAADLFSQAAQTALAANLEEGIGLFRQAAGRWTAARAGISTVADHTPLEEIESLLAETEVFAQAGDAEHFAACCARLSRLMEAVSDAHAPAFENII